MVKTVTGLDCDIFLGVEHCLSLTVHLYDDRLSVNFHASMTVVLVAHLTVKFFGTSVKRTNFRGDERRGKEKKKRHRVSGENGEGETGGRDGGGGVGRETKTRSAPLQRSSDSEE